MNPTQLRILFDHWIRYDREDMCFTIAELVEAGGFPIPDPADVLEARAALGDAVGFQDDPEVPQATVDAAMARFEKLTADWTVTP